MRRATLLLAVGVAGLAACTSLKVDGPLGAPDPAVPTLPLAQVWERAAGGAFGPSAPTITRQYVTVGTRKGEIVVIDRATGRVVGTQSFGDSVEGQLAASASGGVLYIPTADAKGGVEAFDVQQSRTLWTWDGGPVQGGAVLAGDVVVTSALDGTTVGLAAGTGEVRWTRASAEGVQIQSAPALVDADVIVADDHGQIVRLNAQTGAVRWTADVGEPVYATPTAAGDVFVTTTRGRVTRLDAETGAAVWSVDAERTLRASPAAVSTDAVLVGFTDGTVRALDRETGAERWRYRTDGNVTARPGLLGDHVAIGTMDRRLLLLEAATGREVWSVEMRGRVKSAIGVGGGLVVALTEPGHVIAFQTAQ